jgi:hypothetical protein
MPTILRVGPYRLFFYSGDGGEPAHVHIERDDAVAKVSLNPVRLERNVGFRAAELRRIEQIVADNRQRLLEAWDDFFSG